MRKQKAQQPENVVEIVTKAEPGDTWVKLNRRHNHAINAAMQRLVDDGKAILGTEAFLVDWIDNAAEPTNEKRTVIRYE